VVTGLPMITWQRPGLPELVLVTGDHQAGEVAIMGLTDIMLYRRFRPAPKTLSQPAEDLSVDILAPDVEEFQDALFAA
jgi:hypothetical protein